MVDGNQNTTEKDSLNILASTWPKIPAKKKYLARKGIAPNVEDQEIEMLNAMSSRLMKMHPQDVGESALDCGW